MKKLLSLALSIAMIMSIAVVALASDPNPIGTPGTSIDTGAVSTGKVTGIAGPFKNDSDNNVMNLAAGVQGSVAYGGKIYFALTNGATAVSESDAVKSMTVKADWELGEDLVKSISIVKKRTGTGPSVYGYFIEIAINAAATETSSDDLVGTLTVKKSTDADYKLEVNSENYFDFDVNLPVVYGNANMSLITDSKKLFNFDPDGSAAEIAKDPTLAKGYYDDEDEYELTFAEIPDATFTVDVTSQGKVILACNTDYNSTIAGQYPLANLDFINGNGGSFNKIGELFLPADAGSFLYVLNSDGTLALSNSEYDSYEEGFFIKTRTLGSYVISDVELDLAAAATEPAVDDVVEAVDTTNANPTTGAAA